MQKKHKREEPVHTYASDDLLKYMPYICGINFIHTHTHTHTHTYIYKDLFIFNIHQILIN